MAILRIADYVQLDADRAPTLLLNLKEPQSPQSIEEWHKHGAIASISWDHKNPAGLCFDISAGHGLRTHLQLRELLADLQREMDTASAVLDETYAGPPKLKALRLSRRRVYTNLDEPSLHCNLAYVPRLAALRSADDLFRLVVRDLYGNHPEVAGRELLQNAVDAVRERRRGERDRALIPEEEPGFSAEFDAELELREHADGSLDFRVTDRGVGMSSDTIIDFFLQAGASYTMFPDPHGDGAPGTPVELLKAGRFGIGVFAAFLLGPQVRVRTRKIGAARGLQVSATQHEDLVELRWVDCPVGTEIIVPFQPHVLAGNRSTSRLDSAQQLRQFLIAVAQFFEMQVPTMGFFVVDPDGLRTRLDWRGEIPSPGKRLPDDWRSLKLRTFESVLWAVPLGSALTGEGGFVRSPYHGGRLAHNGIVIRDVDEMSRSSNSLGFRHDVPFGAQPSRDSPYGFRDSDVATLVGTPAIAVFDARHRLGVSLTRYSLVDPILEFEDELLEAIGLDVVAHSLVAGPRRHPLGLSWGSEPMMSRDGWMPLLPGLGCQFTREKVLVLWMPPGNPWDTAVEQVPKGFFSRLTACTWRQAPLRVALRAHRDQDSSYGNRLTSRAVSKSTQWLGQVLGRPLGKMLFIESDSPSAGMITMPGGDLNDYLRGIVVKDPRSGARQIWRPLRAVDGDNSDDARLLTAIADELIETCQVFGLAILNSDSSAPCPPRPLVRPWLSLIGQYLPRNPTKRQAVARGLIARNRDLRVLTNKWSRVLDSGK